MSEKFTSLDIKTYKTYLELVRALADAGFDNEFDNSLVIRALTARIDQVWQAAGAPTPVSFQTHCELDQKCGKILKILIRSDASERAQETVVLFESSGALKVSTNVLAEKTVARARPLQVLHYPYLQKDQVLAHLEVLETSGAQAPAKASRAAIAALFDSLAPEGRPSDCAASLQVEKEAISLEFYIREKKIFKASFSLK